MKRVLSMSRIGVGGFLRKKLNHNKFICLTILKWRILGHLYFKNGETQNKIHVDTCGCAGYNKYKIRAYITLGKVSGEGGKYMDLKYGGLCEVGSGNILGGGYKA